MKLSRPAIAAYVALIFASGMVLGVFGQRLYTVSSVSAKAPKNPEEFRKKYLDEMRTRLKLSATQQDQLNTILDETRTRYHDAHERIKPELSTIRNEQTDKVRAMLNPEQKAEYEKMRRERDERMKRENSGNQGSGPGL